VASEVPTAAALTVEARSAATAPEAKPASFKGLQAPKFMCLSTADGPLAAPYPAGVVELAAAASRTRCGPDGSWGLWNLI